MVTDLPCPLTGHLAALRIEVPDRSQNAQILTGFPGSGTKGHVGLQSLQGKAQLWKPFVDNFLGDLDR